MNTGDGCECGLNWDLADWTSITRLDHKVYNLASFALVCVF